MKPENRKRAESLLAAHGVEIKQAGDGYGIGRIGIDGHDTPRWPTDGAALAWALRHPGKIGALGEGKSVFDAEDVVEAPAPRM